MDLLDDDDGLQEDYYAILNVNRDASTEQITRAFRKLSLLYHPDRHGGGKDDDADADDGDVAEGGDGDGKGARRQAHALDAFHRLQRAFDVLSDGHKRAIYDTLGERGLRVSGWELVPQVYSPHQIREEFDRLRRQAEVERENQRTNPTGSFKISLNATDLMRPDTVEEIESGLSNREPPYCELSSLSMEQSIEAPLGRSQRLTVGGRVRAANGRGTGGVNAAWRTVLGLRSWVEVSLGLSESEGTTLSCKATRTFSKRMFGAVQPFVAVDWHAYTWADMLVPGIELSVTRQLDRHLSGVISARLGGGSQNFVTTLVYDDQCRWHVAAGIVMGSASFVTVSTHYRCASLLAATAADCADASDADANCCVLDCGVKLGTFGLVADAGFETQVTSYSRFGCSTVVAVPTGGLRLRLRWRRGGHWYEVDTTLCDSMDYLPSSFVLGVCAPALLFWMAAKMTMPYLDRWFMGAGDADSWQSRAKLLREETERRREQAMQAVELMRATASRIRGQEESRLGLVIVDAKYGQLAATAADYSFGAQYGGGVDRVVDVSIPLQCLVSESKLLLTDSSKSQLPGFYDPAMGCDKSLVITYRFRNEEHRLVARDNEAVCLPKRSHLISATSGLPFATDR